MRWVGCLPTRTAAPGWQGDRAGRVRGPDGRSRHGGWSLPGRVPGVAPRQDGRQEHRLIVEELNPRPLRPVIRGTNTVLRRYSIAGAGIEHITLPAGRARYGYPGLLARSSSG